MKFKTATMDDYDAAFDYIEKLWINNSYDKYVSSIITNETERGKGYGVQLMEHAKELAIQNNCKGIILDSAFYRKDAHRFYEIYDFEKSCYGFDLII